MLIGLTLMRPCWIKVLIKKKNEPTDFWTVVNVSVIDQMQEGDFFFLNIGELGHNTRLTVLIGRFTASYVYRMF